MTSVPMDEPSELLAAIDKAAKGVRTKALDFSFNELFDMYTSGELEINVDYQRLFRWTEVKQSQFIESLILELPIPPIYVIEIEDGKYELIDGLQRLSTYFHFRGRHPQYAPDEGRALVLEGCDVLRALNGRRYDTLPTATQIRLKRQSVRVEVLRRESNKRLRYHMFKRLNTGGEILSEQEIRNCTIRLLGNEINDFLKKCARNSDFIACTAEVTDEKREQLYLEELVLRFFAMKNDLDTYTKNIGDFLTDFMEGVAGAERRKIPFDYAAEAECFDATFKVLNEALGEAAFSGVNKQGRPMGYFSVMHFEALTLGIQSHLAALVEGGNGIAERFKDALTELKREPDFERWTKGGGLNYPAAVQNRIRVVEAKVSLCLTA